MSSPLLSFFPRRNASVSPSSARSSTSFSSSFFFSSSFRPRRRQVGIRAAVNSPAPLSALMSLLLFALLNAIRAYFVSLSLRPVPPGTALPRPFLDFPTLSWCFVYMYRRARARKSSPRLLDSGGRYTNTHATRGCARKREVSRRSIVGRGVARGEGEHSNQPTDMHPRTLLCNF